MELKLPKKKFIDEDNLARIIKIGIGFGERLNAIESGCITDFSEDKNYLKGEACFYNGYIYRALVSTTGAWVDSRWEKVGDCIKDMQLDNAPTKDSDKFVNSGTVYSSLFTTKQRTVIDTPENYVACQSTDTDALEVVADGSALTPTQVELSTVQAFVPTASIGEYYQHVDEVNHLEDYEDNLYRLKDDSYSSTEVDEKIKEVNDRITEVASGGLKPLEMATYRTFFDNLVITADGYEPQP